MNQRVGHASVADSEVVSCPVVCFGAVQGNRVTRVYGQPLQAVLKFFCSFFRYFVISSFLSCHFSAYCLCLF